MLFTSCIFLKNYCFWLFQVELFESAKLKNTIACLKSEMGKTFIAVMLIREKAIEVKR